MKTNANKIDIRAAIFKRYNAKAMVKRVEAIEELEFYVKEMTVADSGALQAFVRKNLEGEQSENFSAEFLAQILYDKEGERLFDAANTEDIDALKSLPEKISSIIIHTHNQINSDESLEKKPSKSANS